MCFLILKLNMLSGEIILDRFKKNKLLDNLSFKLALIIILVIIFLTIFAPLLTRYDPVENDSRNRLKRPTMNHIMGTDEFGRDIFTRILYGARTSILIGTVVVLLTTVSGIIIGVLAGYYSKIDNIIMRVLDALMAFPSIIIAISLAAIWGGGIYNVIFALTFSYFPKMARLVRAQVISAKDLEYIESARAIAATDIIIIFRYILKNNISPILIQASLNFARAILDEAALSFLGVGIMPPNASLGGMISDARSFLSAAPWITIFPGLVIVITVFTFNLLGDSIREVLDPRLK